MNVKSEKFKELAENRVNKVIDEIRKVGNLSNKNRYEYSEEQVKKIFNAIESATKDAKSLFRTETASDNRFKLD